MPCSIASIVIAALAVPLASASDWPQWCGTAGKNMVSPEKGLPDSFSPGEKKEGVIDLATAKNVKWGVKVCNAFYGTPTVTRGRVFVGGVEPGNGIFACLDAATGKQLWKWKAPPKKFPNNVDGFHLGVYEIPGMMGVCSSAAVDGDRVYFVSNRFEVVCLDLDGKPIWNCDMQEKLGVFPCDTANGAPLIEGDLLYVQTSNGIDRNSFREPSRENKRKFPAPDAPNLIVLDKKTGNLVATDDLHIAQTMLHGQWSSPSLGVVNGRKLIFFGAGDARLCAFEAIPSVVSGQLSVVSRQSRTTNDGQRTTDNQPLKLKLVWSCDLIPPEYRPTPGSDWITLYCLGDKRVSGSLNKHDGKYVGLLEIIATPVFLNNRIYVGVGRDPDHGRGRGAMYCLDATGSGDTTRTGMIWKYQGLDRTLSTASVADGLVYVSDVGGRLHCLDSETGQCYWVHDTACETWGSTLVADGKVYMPTSKGFWVLKAGKELTILSRINLGAKVYATPVVADGTLYVANCAGWIWAVSSR